MADPPPPLPPPPSSVLHPPVLPLPQPTPLSDPLAHARIQCLLVPVGPVRQSVWERWARAIKGYGEIRLSDVPGTSGNVKGGRARYLPPAFPPAQTHLHLSFTTLPPSPSLLPLSLFQVSLFPLAVIGLTDLSDTTRRWTRAERVAEFDRLIADVFPANQVFPLTRRCFGVEEDVYEELERPASRAGGGCAAGEPLGRVEESGIAGMVEIDASDAGGARGRDTPDEARFDRRGFEEKLVVVPQEGNVEVVLGMLMADVCASVLTELGEMATALESPSGASTLQSSLLPTITVKPIPKATNGRPRSVNGYHHLAVSSNVIPPPARSPSPAISVAPHHSFSTSQPNLTDKKLPSLGGRAAPDQKAIGSGIKRSTTGLGFASVSRVVSGKAADPPAHTPSSSTGRLKKLQADFWLLAGRLPEAIAGYTEALSSLKSSGDHLWQASALEGLAAALFLEAWEGRSQSDAHTPFTSSAIMQTVHEHLTAAGAAYSRTPCPPPSLFAHGTVNGEEIMTRLHVSLALRHARLLFLTWAACGFGTPSMNATVYQQLPRSYPPLDYARKGRVYVRLTQMSRISRMMISATAARAHGPWMDVLPEDSRLEAFATLAGLARLVGMERKEVFYLREVVGCAVHMLGQKRAHDSIGRAALAEGDHVSLEVGSALSTALLTGRIATRRKESTEGNEALLAMIHRVCDIFGLDLYRTARADRPAFGWPELQVEVVKEAVLLTETLPDPKETASYAQLSLRTLSPHLPAGYQLFFLQRSLRALETARRRGIDVESLDWWLPDQLVRAVWMVPLPPAKQLKAGQRGVTVNAARELFLYHPSLRQPNEKERLIPCNEAADYRITLRNPFAFDLEIKDFALCFDGPARSSSPMRIVMAPYSTQTVPYSVVPLAPGTLSVTGCILTLPDGIRRVAPLPSATADAAQGTKRERHRSRGAPGERTALGLRPTLALPEPSDDSHRADINASVVPPQPMLVVKSTSLTHGSVIVYDGESTAVTIHVENLSDTPITYIELRFDDNTAEAAREKLADDSNTTESRYNIERELLDRPVIRWQRPDDPRIPPRGASGLVVECLGKAGCESAIVEIEYGTDVGDVRYTRQIICPILLTVRPTLQVVAAAITPLESMGVQSSLSPAMAADNALDSPTGLHATPVNLQRRSSSYRREAESDTQLADAIAKAQKAGLSCLLQVDVCNAFPSPLEGFLARKTGDAFSAVSRRLIKPGAIERLYLPLPRITLGADEVDEAIPALSKRQFVVERSHVSKEQDAQHRSAFWYERALLDQLEMTWAEPGSTRQGNVNVEVIDYTPAMHDAFRQESMEVKLVLTDIPPAGVRTNDFVTVELVVNNRSDRPPAAWPLLYRIEPLAMSPRQPSWADVPTGSAQPLRLPPNAAPLPSNALKNLALDGFLKGQIEAVDSTAPAFGCCFLAAGEYAFRAAVWSGGAVGAQAERKFWFSPELRVSVS